ncbi:hypothetical protein [Pseudochrobactrum sp. MP213Fo]|uniref:hypothetical protein n=1 Tax=Pseudochrobactrum sp. MP213Fo TaxID=3022250 RepID=UPI003BA3D0F9
MDKTVPAGAAILLDFIRKTEVGRVDRASYDVIYGHNQNKLHKPITAMTIGELVDAQVSFTRLYKSSASGGYQFMRATLQDLSRELGLSGRQVFDPDLQDRLGFHLLKRRGYDQFITGKISVVEFARRLAMEWASLPVLGKTLGGGKDRNGRLLDLMVDRGQSYYAGDPLNKALVKPEAIEALLKQVKAAGNTATGKAKPAPAIKPQSVAKSKRFWSWLTAAALPALGLLDWRTQMASVIIGGGLAGYAIYSMPQIKAKIAKLIEAL